MTNAADDLLVDHDHNPPKDTERTPATAVLSRVANNVIVPIDLVRAQKTPGAAFALACQASGLDDKEIYGPLGIDQGYFSNIKSGKATLKAELEPLFCKLVGNRVYPEYRAYLLGCTLVMVECEAERRLRAQEQVNADLQRELALMRSLIRVSKES
jgi:hypothetical protein